MSGAGLCPSHDRVDDPHTASVFIVNDVSTAGNALITRLSLIGGVLMNMTAYETVGKSGVILKHEAFLKTKKTWFLSQGFRDECPRMVEAITNSFGFHAGLKSVLADVDKKDELVARSKKRFAAGYGQEFVFLISKNERHEFDPKEHKNVLHSGKLI